MAKAFRLTKTNYLSIAFTGEGAQMHGGRWNSRGVPVVYLASTRALAVLELLVHVTDIGLLAASYSFIPVEIPDGLIERLDRKKLPAGWNTPVISGETLALGDEWIRSGRSAILAVPSVIVERELNYLLNPGHPDFSTIVAGKPEGFSIDPRFRSKNG